MMSGLNKISIRVGEFEFEKAKAHKLRLMKNMLSSKKRDFGASSLNVSRKVKI